MDNPAADLAPDPDQLARLLELRNRYGLSLPLELRGPMSESERHRRETGHPLRPGCCRAPTDQRAA